MSVYIPSSGIHSAHEQLASAEARNVLAGISVGPFGYVTLIIFADARDDGQTSAATMINDGSAQSEGGAP